MKPPHASLWRLLLIALAALGLHSSPAASQERPGPAVAAFTLRDCAGRTHTPREWARHKAIVLFFMGTECPLSNFYGPEIEALAKAGPARGIAVYGVQSDPSVTPADAAKHAAEYRLSFPILMDPQQLLARPARIAVVPEVAVLAPSGRILYSGRIDDRYSLNGKRRDEPRVRDLDSALTAVLAGKAPAVARVPAFGCPLPEPAPAGK